MLFQSSLRKELARSFGATLVVLMTIVMTIVLIRTLGQAAKGSISPQDVMLIMAYSALGRLPTILALSLFIAIVSTLSRMYRDSEMVVWFASGRGLAAFIKPLFRFSWPVLVVVTLTALFVWPWANKQTLEMRARYEQRSDLDRIAPGQFQESSNGSRVFFIDKASEGRSTSNNIFIASTENGKTAVTTARTGHVTTLDGEQMLILENGQRLDNPGTSDGLKVSEFGEYGVRTGNKTAQGPGDLDKSATSTHNLIKNPTRVNLGELSSRAGMALAGINLVVLALALAAVNPRAGRSSNMIFVLLTFVFYNNMIGMGQSWIASGQLSLAAVMLVLHGGVFVAGLLWLGKRHFNWQLKDHLPARSGRSGKTGGSLSA